MKQRLITFFILLSLWQICAMVVDRSVILPLPVSVFSKMSELLLDSSFYLHLGTSIFRISWGIVIAMSIGISFGFLTVFIPSSKPYIDPVLTVIQSIPQIAYILILLVWLNPVPAIVTIITMMIFPVFYNNTHYGLYSIETDLLDVLKLYPHSKWYTIKKVYFPLIKSYLLSALVTSIPQGFKVGIMAEVFIQTNKGIGSCLYLARTRIDMISIYAWVIWLLVIILEITHVTKKHIQKETTKTHNSTGL